MQLQDDILGGLPPPPPPSRREQLATEGLAAQAKVRALLRKARSRALGQAIARTSLILLAGLSLSALIAALTSSRIALLALSLLSVAFAALLSRRWPVKDERKLARLLGGPSELLSSVELSREPPQGASVELLSLLHLRAAEAARKVDLAKALPAKTLRWPLLALLAVTALWLIAPHRERQGLLRLWKGDEAIPDAELTPIAGDLSITYLYPSYTSLPARTEEGTSGDLRAPKGTQVRLSARADRDLAQAFAVVNGQAVQLAADGPGHRQLSGTFTLSQSGQWSLRFADQKGRVTAQGPSRPIEVQQDAAPQVSIDDPKQAVLEVDPLRALPLSWSATDDYGVSKVELVYQKPGGAEERVVLQEPQAAAKRLRGTYPWEIAKLSLRAGDRVSYHLEALDNDAIDNPQKGVSPTQAIKIFSAAEHTREALVQAQALWERLVALLGDRLEEKPAPQAAEEGAQWYAKTSQKDKDARQLVNEMSSVSQALVKDKLPETKAVARALRYAASSLSPVVQRTSLARAPLSRGAENREGSARSLANSLSSEVKEEEKDVLYLQDLLDTARLEAMQEIGKELAASRRELARLAEKLRKADTEETRKEILAEVERLRERMQELMRQMQEMSKGILDEHLNREAQDTMEKDTNLLDQLSDVQKKLQNGKVEDALKELDKLSQMAEKLEADLQKNAGEQQSDQYSEEAKQLSEAASELKDIEAREQELQKKTQQIRRESREAAQKRFEQKGGKELAKKLREKAEQAKKAIAQIDQRIAEQLGLEDTLEQARERTSDASRALELNDFDEALDAAERAERATETLQGRLAMENDVAQRYPNFARDPQSVRKGLEGSMQAQQPLQEIVQQLQQALPREGQDMNGDQLQRMKQQAKDQEQLDQRLGKVREQLKSVGQKVPIFGPQHEQMLEQAQQGMGSAQQKLQRGEPRGAQAGEEQAMEKLSQFEQAMQKLAQQQSGKGQGQGVPMPWGEPQGGDEDGREDDSNPNSMKHDRVEIPDAESSRAPAEFRKELLDAMKQQPPQNYKERVKQYYEELVK